MNIEDRITDVTVVNIDATGEVRYTALIDNNKHITYVTDGVKRRHMSENIWMDYVKGIANGLNNNSK